MPSVHACPFSAADTVELRSEPVMRVIKYVICRTIVLNEDAVTDEGIVKLNTVGKARLSGVQWSVMASTVPFSEVWSRSSKP
jgi:hypothetical protein